MTVEEKPNYSLKAKTGWTGQLGWYVGYIDTKNDAYLFALNIDVKEMEKLKLRKTLVMEALRAKHII